jgi:hypothetical protein
VFIVFCCPWAFFIEFLASPTRSVLRSVGIDADSPNTAIMSLATKQKELDTKLKEQIEIMHKFVMLHKYSTQNEYDNGTRIFNDLESGELQRLSIDSHNNMVAMSLLNVDPPGGSVIEEDYVNKCFWRILKSLTIDGLDFALNIYSSPLVDQSGREQREDIVVTDGEEEVWPAVVTMIIGKKDLEKRIMSLLLDRPAADVMPYCPCSLGENK